MDTSRALLSSCGAEKLTTRRTSCRRHMVPHQRDRPTSSMHCCPQRAKQKCDAQRHAIASLIVVRDAPVLTAGSVGTPGLHHAQLLGPPLENGVEETCQATTSTMAAKRLQLQWHSEECSRMHASQLLRWHRIWQLNEDQFGTKPPDRMPSRSLLGAAIFNLGNAAEPLTTSCQQVNEFDSLLPEHDVYNLVSRMSTELAPATSHAERVDTTFNVGSSEPQSEPLVFELDL